MIDNHVHVGWYTDGYHSPKDVWQAVQEAGIDEIAVSSTSTCAELYKLAVSEMRELIRLGGPRIHPLLWLTPRMMKTWGIRYMLHSKIKWQGVKLHWTAHREWYYNKKILHNALEVARWLQVPVLLHTGEFKECRAGVFMDICSQFNDLTFVLAHGRPLQETLEVLTRCTNVYVDTAFMPINDVATIVQNGYANRLLFGTDAPINTIFFPNTSTTDYISQCLLSLEKVVPKESFHTIMSNSIYR